MEQKLKDCYICGYQDIKYLNGRPVSCPFCGTYFDYDNNKNLGNISELKHGKMILKPILKRDNKRYLKLNGKTLKNYTKEQLEELRTDMSLIRSKYMEFKNGKIPYYLFAEFIKNNYDQYKINLDEWSLNFSCDEHEERFMLCADKFKYKPNQPYHIAFYYILTSNFELYEYTDRIYTNGELNLENINNILNKINKSYGCMLKVAIKLFNDSNFEDYDFLSDFDLLDSFNKKIILEAIKIRYNIDRR
ncbi:hypothetical protein KHQ81_15615 (plasmid) [Mycoplasmatota bacterium]|nr:hypothetical protein KHQ81_15615 [Mycoplasmatota bacterium]